MKNIEHKVIAYERKGPLSDMFVPLEVTIRAVAAPERRVPRFAIALLLVAAIPTFMLPGGTLSFFNDAEHSTGNTFGAGPLDITIFAEHVPDDTPDKDPDLTPDPLDPTIYIDQPGETFIFTPSAVANSLPFRYKVSGVASGNASFCPEIDAVGSAPFVHAGGVTAFSLPDTDSLVPWSLTLSLNTPAPGVVDGQICILDLTFEAYQVGGAVGTEYHDTEHVQMVLTADPPVTDVYGEANPPVVQVQNFSAPTPPPAEEPPPSETPPAEVAEVPPTEPPPADEVPPAEEAPPVPEPEVVVEPPPVPEEIATPPEPPTETPPSEIDNT